MNMKNIIIELVNGEKIVNNPAIGMNFHDPSEIAQFLHRNDTYTVYTDEDNFITVTNQQFLRAKLEEETPIVTVVGRGHKYVKLQQVIELMKHAEKMWSLPYYEFDELSKTKTKIDNTMAFLKRNAKTKEELT